ncbi:MAG: EthD family reductase [Betaproteobacteria bacterium]|nr:MAG: EthD family reductase [Betaproteobacteria bacterium]
MKIAYFLTYHDEANPARRASDADVKQFTEVLTSLAGVNRALVFTPEKANDPYLKDEPPQLAAELYFDDIAPLERAAARNGALQALGDLFPSEHVTQQAMLVRSFGVPEPLVLSNDLPCTYLVGYEGPAEDLNAWLAYYIENHPPLMARMPGIREFEICTRIDWCTFLPWRRDPCMQRNKVVFDSVQALTDALRSPIRHEMREDYKRFPPFSGKVFHYPMATRELLAR